MGEPGNNEIKTITLWYNSYLGFQSSANLDVENGMVRYKSNFYEEGNENYESVFLRDKKLVEQFVEDTSFVMTWQSHYGSGACIDGYYWKLSINFSDRSIFECSGENGKSETFDELVAKFETLIEKPMGHCQSAASSTPNKFSGITLLIPNRCDSERNAVALGWEKVGGEVVRVDKFWEPPDSDANNIKIYGDAAFSLVLGNIKNIKLIEPDFFVPITLDPKWLNRKIELAKLGDIHEFEYPVFAKPIIPKQFRSGVYNNVEELEHECRGLWEYASILLSEIVTFESEIRCFVLDDQVMTMNVYEGEADIDVAREFAISFVSDVKNRRLLVNTYVLDVGYIKGRGWAVIEANPTWGSGLNGCEAEKVIECIYYATKPLCGINDVDFSVEEVEDILFDGTYADMCKLKGYSIRYSYDKFSSSLGDMMNLVVGRTLSHSDGFHSPPNCLKYFGYSHDFVDDYT